MSKRGRERPSDYYDKAYATSKAYYKLPEEIKEYYEMWMAGAKSVSDVNPSMVVDLGCGAGHFGEILKRLKQSGEIDLGLYYGYDFSPIAIKMAREMVNDTNFAFQIKDLYDFNFPRGKAQDAMYVSYEFLEHIEKDLQVISKIPTGSYISFSVPSFDSKGHVRHFKTEKEVYSRYSQLIDIKTCQHFVKEEATASSPALIIYLCFGVIK